MTTSKTKWKKGESGNPKGRPPGTSKISELRSMLEPHSKELVLKAKELALGGDTTALRLCLERLIPPIKIKDELVVIKDLKATDTLTQQGQSIIKALAVGEITPTEAATLMQTISSQARIIEVDELESRITALENNNGK